MPDVLLDAGRRLQRPVTIESQSYEESLKKAFESLPKASGSASGTEAASDSWTLAQQQGGWWREAALSAPARNSQTSSRPASLPEEAQFDGTPGEYPLHFLPFASQAFFDGSLAHLPWLQELPDVIATAMWSSWIEINPKTANDLGLSQGDLVEVASSQGTLQAPALLSPGIAPDVVAMPVGQGHQTFTRYASGRGSNPLSILAPVAEPITGALAWAATRVRIRKVDSMDLTDTRNRLVLFAGGLREHEEEHR
jgi:anaerobic selenocysteine-containing dehydrogenase